MRLRHNGQPHALDELADAGLVVALEGRELGGWALGPDAVEQLRMVYLDQKPSLTIEFGSGLSTICLAYFAAQAGWRDRVAVVSLDQDEGHAQATRRSLFSAGLAGMATVLHAPSDLTRLRWRDSVDIHRP